MWQSVKVSNVFNTFTLKQFSGKQKTVFIKLEHYFLVETTKIKDTSFPFKTALSEANVKTGRMPTTKWTSHEEWSYIYISIMLRKNQNVILCNSLSDLFLKCDIDLQFTFCLYQTLHCTFIPTRYKLFSKHFVLCTKT